MVVEECHFLNKIAVNGWFHVLHVCLVSVV
jgi:hypothetical protein